VDPNNLRTHILVDSIKRLSKIASWHRRQGGRKANEHVRIADALSDEGATQIAVLRSRGEGGDEVAKFAADNPPTFGRQAWMDLPTA
jgi:hypothetical protein